MPDNANPNQVWVAMRHPDIQTEDAAVTTRAAFDEVWEEKGWKLVSGSESDRQEDVDVKSGMPTKVAKAAATEKGA